MSVNGVECTLQPRPTLRTLCETLAARGDPEHASMVRIGAAAAAP